MGWDSLSARGWYCVRPKQVTLSPMQDDTNSNQQEAEHECHRHRHRHRHGQVEFFCG